MLDQFRSYLEKNSHIDPKYIPYYLKWLSDGYAYANEPVTHRMSTEHKQAFLNHLSKNHEDWQVRQADYALRLYNFFLSRQGAQLTSETTDFEDRWRTFEDDTRKALRLRHRSLSTEKSYLLWLRQFRGFVGPKDPTGVEGSDLLNFLTHLAVQRKVSASTQTQALNAIVFLFRHVLEKDLD